MKQVNCEFCTPLLLLNFGFKTQDVWFSRANWSACFEGSDIEIDYKGMLRLEFFELLFRFWDLSEM